MSNILEDEVGLNKSHIRIEQRLSSKVTQVIYEGPCDSKDDLKRLLFTYKGCPVTITVMFDDID